MRHTSIELIRPVRPKKGLERYDVAYHIAHIKLAAKSLYISIYVASLGFETVPPLIHTPARSHITTHLAEAATRVSISSEVAC